MMKKVFYLTLFALFFQLQNLTAQQRPDKMPVFPGCEAETAKMTCFKEKLLDFIADNFNSELVKKTDSKESINLLVRFVINEEGKPEDIRIQSAYKDLNKEMESVIKKLPTIVPAQADGYPIRMQYELPVIFGK
jgi:hypothetical protein